MNAIGWVILIAIVIDYSLNLFSDYLNLKNISRELPEAFKDLYDQEKYEKSQEYLAVNTRFGFVSSTFNLLLILGFWFGGGFPMLDSWVRSFETNNLMAGLLYIGTLLIARAVLSLPFSIYSTFVIEERFGFNKTTWKTFMTDLVKGLILSVILGGILLSMILSFFEYAGANAWFYCWVAVTIFMLAIQYIIPTWIMPLFNKFTPLEEGELKSAIMSYARSIQFSLNNIFVMDGSKRSSKSNAFFTGFGKNKRIVLFDTLISNHSVSELVAVLAHEMGHFKKKHILSMLVIGIIQTGIMLFLLSLFITRQALFDTFYVEHVSVYAGLIFFSMLYSPLDFFLGIFMQMLSRKNEYEADRFAVETTEKNKALSEALKKLSVDNLSNLTPHPLYVFLNYSHPPVLKRVKHIEALTLEKPV